MFASIQKTCYWIPAIAISLSVLVLSSVQNPPQPSLNIPHLDKIAHSIIYSLLGFCYFYSFTKGFQKITSWKILLAFLAAILFGALDEFYQSFIPNRFPEFFDWLADIFGILCSFLLILFCKKYLFTK